MDNPPVRLDRQTHTSLLESVKNSTHKCVDVEKLAYTVFYSAFFVPACEVVYTCCQGVCASAGSRG